MSMKKKQSKYQTHPFLTLSCQKVVNQTNKKQTERASMNELIIHVLQRNSKLLQTYIYTPAPAHSGKKVRRKQQQKTLKVNNLHIKVRDCKTNVCM